MTFEVCVTIVLTALCAILAALALGIGFIAVWGYNGVKEVRNSITLEVTKKAEEALAAKLREYPDAPSIIRVFKQFEEQSEFMAKLRDQMAASESNNVAHASNMEEDKENQANESIADDYPNGQEGGFNASSQ